MTDYYGLSSEELDSVHSIDPEAAAHNIASAYVNSTANYQKLYNGENIILSDVLSLSSQYVEAFNYAFNYILHENELIDKAE